MIENFFSVGLTISVEAFYKNHLPTTLIGWEQSSFLVTRAIYINGQPAKLKSKDSCKIRFLKDGVAYGFVSEIISVQFFPFPLMFIKYPTDIECVKVRVAERYKIDLPAKLFDCSRSQLSEGMILDISEGGCALHMPVTGSAEISPELSYVVSFKILDTEISANCEVRKLNKGPEQYLIGMEFTDMSDVNRENLGRVLAFLRKSSGKQ